MLENEDVVVEMLVVMLTDEVTLVTVVRIDEEALLPVVCVAICAVGVTVGVARVVF